MLTLWLLEVFVNWLNDANIALKGGGKKFVKNNRANRDFENWFAPQLFFLVNNHL